MRHIIWNGYSSEEKGLVMSGSTPLSSPTPKISGTEIELADGYIDTSRVDGKLHYKTRTISYVFTYVIDAYNQYDLAKDANTLNRECVAAERNIRSWFFGQTDRKLYDTAYCNLTSEKPITGTGHYFTNASCQEIKVNKAMGIDKWVLQFQVSFAFDPYIYEIGADPIDYVMFAGPTEDAVESGTMKIRIYNKGTSQRMLWVNDNTQVINTYEVTRYDGVLDRVSVTLTFKPSCAGLYSGPIGFYLNHYFDFTFNGALYQYHIDGTINVQSGNLTWVESDRLVTDHEFGYTDQAGFILSFDLVSTSGNAIISLMNANNHQAPLSMVWGTAKVFDTSLEQEYIIDGVTKGAHEFQIVDGTDGQGGILMHTIPFRTAFELDDDPYNELRMSSAYYGFYTMSNSDVLRKVL